MRHARLRHFFRRPVGISRRGKHSAAKEAGLLLLGGSLLPWWMLVSGCNWLSSGTVPSLAGEAAYLRSVSRMEASEEWNQITLLDLTTAQRIALEANFDLRNARTAIETARMAYFQSLSAYLPQVNYNFSLSQSLTQSNHLHNPPDTIAPQEAATLSDMNLTASYLIFDGLVREFDALIARSGFAESIQNYENMRRLLLRGVAYSYYDILLAEAELEIARSDCEFQRSNLSQSTVRFQSGFLSKSEQLNFKILYNRSLCTLALRQEALEVRRFALANLLGRPDGTLPDTVEFPGISTLDETLNYPRSVYLSMALETRPDLRQLAERVRQQEYRKGAALGAFFPTVTIAGTLDYNTNASDYHDGTVGGRNYNSFGPGWNLGVNWELFDGLRRYNRFRETRFLQQQAQLALDAAALNAVNEVLLACVNLETQSELVAYYREMMEWVFEQRQLVEVEFWAGHVTITRLNEAQSELIDAQNAYAATLIGLQKARAQLAAAVNLESAELPLHAAQELERIPVLDAMFSSYEKLFNYRTGLLHYDDKQP